MTAAGVPARMRSWLVDAVPGGVVGRRLGLMAAVDAVGTGAFLAVSVVFLTRTVGLSAAQVGLGLTLSAAIALLSTVPVGALADRYGPRRMIVICSLWRGACFAVYPLVDSFAVFVIVMCVLGLVDKTAPPLEQALVAQAVPEPDRVRMMAVLRVLLNVGFTVGALVGSAALLVDTPTAYMAVLLANGASFVAVAVLAARMPLLTEHAGSVRRSMSLRVLRDRPYLALAVLNALLTLHMTLLAVGMPLWITQHSRAPVAVVAVLLAVNTVLAVTFQIRASRRAETTQGAVRSLRLASVSLAVCCLLLALVPPLPAVLAVAVLLLGMLALTAGELLQAAGGWSLSFSLARAGQQGAYLSLFWLGVSVQQILAPVVVVGVISVGPLGWVGLAVVFVLTGLLVPVASAWAQRERAHEVAREAAKQPTDSGRAVPEVARQPVRDDDLAMTSTAG